MLPFNFKDFLTSGVCLQTGTDRFKVMIGPFTAVPLDQMQASKSSTFLYKANFWDFLNSPLNPAQNFVYSPASAFELDREEFIGLLRKEVLHLPGFEWHAADEVGFKKQFEWSQELFKSGKLKKTVPVIVQRAAQTPNEQNIKWMLLELLRKKNFGWAYAFFENGSGMIGLTPEILLEWNLHEGIAKTAAIAGTVAVGEGSHHEISNDPKIRQEHNYVIDDIQLKLSGFDSAKEPTEVLELKHLLHLQTVFKIKMNDLTDFLKCASCLHPTAAMGIYPDDLGKLKEFSDLPVQNDRKHFAGPIGVINTNKAQILVPIRNLIFDKNGSYLYSGCGITAESRYDLELAELENKRNSVKKMLGLMNDEL
jgi:menaquinone-specific isochorismate synthase